MSSKHSIIMQRNDFRNKLFEYTDDEWQRIFMLQDYQRYKPFIGWIEDNTLRETFCEFLEIIDFNFNQFDEKYIKLENGQFYERKPHYEKTFIKYLLKLIASKNPEFISIHSGYKKEDLILLENLKIDKIKILHKSIIKKIILDCELEFTNDENILDYLLYENFYRKYLKCFCFMGIFEPIHKNLLPDKKRKPDFIFYFPGINKKIYLEIDDHWSHKEKFRNDRFYDRAASMQDIEHFRFTNLDIREMPEECVQTTFKILEKYWLSNEINLLKELTEHKESIIECFKKKSLTIKTENLLDVISDLKININIPYTRYSIFND